MSAKISVIVPTYDRAGLVGRSVESVFEQTHRDLEVIVVDDASTDDTEREIRDLFGDEVRYLRHRENRGPSAARNTGILNATGEFLAFLDSDDRWLPEKLEVQLARFSEDPGLGCVYTGWEWVRPDGTIRLRRQPHPVSGLIENKPRWFYNTVPDLMVRTDLVRGCLFDEGIRAYENLEWLIRLNVRSRWGFVPEILVHCQDHASHRASDSEVEKLKGLEFILSRYGDLLAEHVAELYHLRLSAGALALASGEARARDHLLKAVKLRPLSLRAWSRLLMTSIPHSLHL